MSTLKRPFAEFGGTARSEAAGDSKRLASSAHSFGRPTIDDEIDDEVVGKATNGAYGFGLKNSFSRATYSESNEFPLSESNSSSSANKQATSILSQESSSSERAICYGMASTNHYC